MDLEVPISLFTSQPLEGNFRITLNAPSLPPTFNSQWSYLGNISCPFPPRAAPFRPYHHMNIGPKWASLLPVSLQSQCSYHMGLSDKGAALDPLWAQVSPPLPCSLAFRRSFVGSPKGWGEGVPTFLPATSKELLLLYVLYFGSWVKDFIEKEACSLNKQTYKQLVKDKTRLLYHGTEGPLRAAPSCPGASAPAISPSSLCSKPSSGQDPDMSGLPHPCRMYLSALASLKNSYETLKTQPMCYFSKPSSAFPVHCPRLQAPTVPDPLSLRLPHRIVFLLVFLLCPARPTDLQLTDTEHSFPGTEEAFSS